MFQFSLDGRTTEMDLRLCSDYSSFIIKSAIAIPLIRLNKASNTFTDGLCRIVSSNKTRIVLKVKDYSFGNGTKLTTLHIKTSFEWLREHNKRVALMLLDLKSIQVKDDLVILKHKSNTIFNYYLTSLSISPFINYNDFCGNFIIKNEYEKSIICVNNRFNNPKDCELKFNFIENNIDDVNQYQKGNLDFTNPTTFPVIYKNHQDVNTDSSIIDFSISFRNRKLLQHKFDKLREIIATGINRKKIAKLLYPILLPKYDFCVSNLNNYKLQIDKTITYKEQIHLSLGYDNYYPNKIIARMIQKQLYNYNIIIELIETNFYNRNSIVVDMQLNLTFPDYYNDSFYYCSKYFQLISELANIKLGEKVKKLIKLYKKSNNLKYFNLLKSLIDSNNLEIPLFRENAIYFSKNKKFKFSELNFEDLPFDT